MTELRMHGIKSHDYHVFMQKLISITFPEMLPKHVWSASTEMFLSICSTTLDVTKLYELEHNVVVIMCNIAEIFPPTFFDSMEHLIIHFSYKARIGGPVQYRWMYPFERFLHNLKKNVKNKAHVDVSIVEAYTMKEINLFSSQYFESDVFCRQSRPSRNDDLTSNEDRI
ncbi:UNVERIFIED_CONTAM: hypothetical protein Sradi_1299200 [Sesamum radiatum]|uniref:DUF4218 domain-containing protein n=1 Tax=Sesamum radiatum TaxID=300843 RepID=A0AAW2UPN7_SESRA